MGRFKYFIEGIEVFPLNGGTSNFTLHEEEESGSFFVNDHDDEIVFHQNDTFNFKSSENLDFGKELNFTITKLCDGVYSLYWYGLFSPSEMKWDNDRCTCSVKPKRREFIIDDFPINIFDSTINRRAVRTGSGGTLRTYLHGIRLDELLDFLIKQSFPDCTGVVSDFFQINPVNPSAIGLGGPNKFMDLVLFSLSDIQEPIPSNLATKEIITFREFMSDLYIMFDVKWYIDEDLALRIESVYYPPPPTYTDLTVIGDGKYIAGLNKYYYDLTKLPSSEMLQIADSKQFAKITYNNPAFTRSKKNSDVKQVKKIYTDYIRIRFQSKNSTADGLFMFACDPTTPTTYDMFTDAFAALQNYYLSPDYLFKYIHRYSRPYSYGQYESLTFDSITDIKDAGGYYAIAKRKVKIQENIIFPLCCEQLFGTSLIKTQLGYGSLVKAVYNSKNDMVTVTLKHEAENPTSFLPTDISNIQLWLPYNEVIQSGGLVSQWTDFSGNARHALQATGANKPSSSGDGVSFTGGKFLDIPAFQLLSSTGIGTVIIAGEYAGLPVNDFDRISVFSNMAVNPGRKFDISYTGIALRCLFDETGVGDYAFLNLPPKKGILVVESVIPSALIRDYTTYNNGTEQFHSHPKTSAAVASNVVRLGDNPTLLMGVGATGTIIIKEIIVYSKVLSDNERKRIEQYLYSKNLYLINV